MPEKNYSWSPDQILEIKRIIDFPSALVFKAWTEKGHVMAWMAPKGFTIPSVESDVRQGGTWKMTMTPPDGGADLKLKGVYRDVHPPKHLVFTHCTLDKEGAPGHETQVTVNLEEHAGKTELTFRQAPFLSEEERDSHESGWNECFDRLETLLAGIFHGGGKHSKRK